MATKPQSSATLEDVLAFAGLLGLAVAVFLYAEWGTIRILAVRMAAWTLYGAQRLHVPGAGTHYGRLLRDYRSVGIGTILRWMGEVWRWVLAPLFGFWALRLFLHNPARRFRVTYDLKGLLWYHAQNFPAALPAARAMRAGRLTETPADTGAWAQAQSPRAYVARLLGHDELAPKPLTPEWRARCEAALRPALGRVVSGITDLVFHEQALLAVFALFVAGEGPGRAGDELLDTLSRGFREGEGGGGHEFVLPDGGRAVGRVLADPVHQTFLASLFAHHAWSSTVLMRALTEGRRKGMIPPSRFLWLKPADRSLWYALHQLAPPLPNEKLRAKRVLAEAAAAHSHYKAEVITNGRLTAPVLAAAVDGLWEAIGTEAQDGS